MVENAGIYYDGVKEWRRKDTAEKTWEYFRTFFAKEFREIRVQPWTSAPEGYGANIMIGGNSNAAEIEMQQQQAEALANLATATAADRQAVAELSISNTTLTHELRAATVTIETLQQRLASCACAPTTRREEKGKQRRPENQQRQHNPSRDFTPLDPDGYCWSHGYHVSKGHNGELCYNTLPGHQGAATRADPMGGSTNQKPELYTREKLGNVDKNYSNLVNYNRNKKLDFNSMCIDYSLEAVADYGTTGHYIIPTTPCTNK